MALPSRGSYSATRVSSYTSRQPRPGRQLVVQQLQSKGKTSAITAPLWRCKWITFQSAVFSVIVVIHTVSS
jgi:hypothetical protein